MTRPQLIDHDNGRPKETCLLRFRDTIHLKLNVYQLRAVQIAMKHLLGALHFADLYNRGRP